MNTTKAEVAQRRAGIDRSIKAVDQFAKEAPRFRVTEGMLEVLDDYLASRGQHGTKEEGQAALRRHFSRLTDTQIESCLRRWKKEMNTEGEQVSWLGSKLAAHKTDRPTKKEPSKMKRTAELQKSIYYFERYFDRTGPEDHDVVLKLAEMRRFKDEAGEEAYPGADGLLLSSGLVELDIDTLLRKKTVAIDLEEGIVAFSTVSSKAARRAAASIEYDF